METDNQLAIINNSSLVSYKISSPTDIYRNAQKYGQDYVEQVFSKYVKPAGMEKSVSDKAISFHDCTNFFGRNATLYWLRFHIADTFAFLGIYDTASAYQIRATAELVLDHEIFGQLTFSEFLCFLQRFKQGRYGKVYNSARPNPQEFLMCLQPFWNELSHERGKAAERERQEQISRDLHSQETMSWDEYKQLTGNANDNPIDRLINEI